MNNMFKTCGFAGAPSQDVITENRLPNGVLYPPGSAVSYQAENGFSRTKILIHMHFCRRKTAEKYVYVQGRQRRDGIQIASVEGDRFSHK
jgi:hypothetical protein